MKAKLRVVRPPVLNAYLDDDGKDLIVWEQTSTGPVERRVRAEFVTWHRTEQLSAEQMRQLKSFDPVTSIRTEGEWVRIGWKDEWARRHGRSGMRAYEIETFEGDVDPVCLWLTETRTPIARPRCCYLDIETDSRVPFSRKEDMRVLVWAISDDNGKVAHGVLEADDDESEAKLLTAMWKVLANYDQVCAWNGGRPGDKNSGFDFYVLAQRTIRRGLPIDIRRWLFLDHLVAWERMHLAESGEEKESLRLEDVAQAVLGEGKTKTPAFVRERFGDKNLGALAWDLWAASGSFRKLLVDYCIEDTELLRKLEKKKGYLALFQTVCEVAGVFGSTRGLFPSVQADGFMLRLGREKNYRFKTKIYDEVDEDEKKKFRGAWVMTPRSVGHAGKDSEWTTAQAREWRLKRGMKSGILTNVHVADFSGMYPNLILTFNLSEDVKIGRMTLKEWEALSDDERRGKCRSPGTGLVTTTEREGILTIAVREMIRLRKYYLDLAASLPPGTPEWQDAMALSTAYKVIANSFYGVTGQRGGRFFDVDIAESVTQNGVYLIKATIREAEKRAMEAIYSDTDSAMVIGPSRPAFDAFTRWCNAHLYPRIARECGCKENTTKIAFEKSFSRLIFTSAKRYCNPPESPIMMADGTFKQLGEIAIGDVVLGWTDGAAIGKKIQAQKLKTRRRLAPSEVVAVHRHVADIVKVTLESGRVIRCTSDHRWRSHGRTGTPSDFVTPKVGRLLSYVASKPPMLTRRQQRAADWLGGIWDGEGSLASDNRGQIIISQSRAKNPEVCRRIEESLMLLGFRFSVHSQRNATSNCETYAIRGSLQERLNFLAWCRPAKGAKLARSLMKSRFAKGDRIVSIEPDGRGEVIGMTTSTGNYVAWGYASKNCGRYSHYKGTEAKADSKPEIRGIEYRRGDTNVLARALQGQMIDLLVGGCTFKDEHGKEQPYNPGIETPCEEIEIYHAAIMKLRERVLSDPLTREQVRRSQSLSKSLKEYEPKPKADGTEGNDLAHVGVARELERRGQAVMEGTRIEYIVVDGSVSPMRVIPAEDFSGDFDRFYLWDTMIYPPTERLLAGAFPDHDWSSWGDVRPKKARGKAAKIPEEQLGFFMGKQADREEDAASLAIPMYATKPLVVRIPEAAGEEALHRVKAVLKKFPGARAVEIVIELNSGASSVLRTSLRVTAGPAFKDALDEALASTAS